MGLPQSSKENSSAGATTAWHCFLSFMAATLASFHSPGTLVASVSVATDGIRDIARKVRACAE
jgi:hypothetical protein